MVLVSSPQTHHTCTHIPQWYESTLIRLTDASASSSQKRKPENPRGSSMKLTCTVTHRGTHTHGQDKMHTNNTLTHTHTHAHKKFHQRAFPPCVVCGVQCMRSFGLFSIDACATRVQLRYPKTLKGRSKSHPKTCLPRCCHTSPRVKTWGLVFYACCEAKTCCQFVSSTA